MCVPHRDYGMRAMSKRGYDVVLIEDCTTTIEVADTVEEMALTKAAGRQGRAGVHSAAGTNLLY